MAESERADDEHETEQDQATFRSWGFEIPPPLYRRRAPIHVPYTTKHGEETMRLAGFVATPRNKTRATPAYTSYRRNAHFYYDDGGYAVSTRALAEARLSDCKRILVHEDPDELDGTVYEFTMRQYMEAPFVPTENLIDPSDTQRILPLDEAIHTWPNHADKMFARSFSNACRYISDKFGWPVHD